MNGSVPVGRRDTRFYTILVLLLLASLLLRLGYVHYQAGADPRFAEPGFDGEYYLDWAGAIAGTGPAQESHGGAFYHAPLYAHALALFVGLFGRDMGLLYYAQHLLSVLTAALIALGLRRALGDGAALGAAALFLLHHPLVFFASRPLGETLAIGLLVAALVAVSRDEDGAAGVAGLLLGLAVVARPNLLLVAPLWLILELSGRRFRRAALLAAGLALVVLPVTTRNWVVSGHPVMVSSNGGLTLYHGNGPGAQGTFHTPDGFTGIWRGQREEATLLARLHSGRELDPVEADGYWGRRALAARAADPVGSLALLARRVVLTLDNHEQGLDYHPALDANPWRWAFPVPLALLLGLAGAGLVARRGGLRGWGTLAACAATPLLFYVSSRYRLPLSALLTIPAGTGLAALSGLGDTPATRTRILAAVVAVALVGLSFGAPLLLPSSAEMRRDERVQGLVDRSLAFNRLGRTSDAERDARRAVSGDPRSAKAQFGLGVVLESLEREDEALEAYQAASVGHGAAGRAAAAANAAAILLRRGVPDQALPILRAALADLPVHAECWNNLVIALVASGDQAAALDAIRTAQQRGVELDPALISAVREMDV